MRDLRTNMVAHVKKENDWGRSFHLCVEGEGKLMGEEVGMSLGGEKLTAFGCSKVNGIEEHGDYLFTHNI